MKRKGILIITAFILALLLPACGDDTKIKPRMPAGDRIEDIPSYVMQGFTLQSVEDGKVLFEIKAKSAQVFELKKKAYVQIVTARYYVDSKKPSLLWADRAVIDTDTNFIDMQGNVKVKSAEGMQLETDRLFWDNKQKKMYSDAKVTVYKGKNTLYGIGFESDSQLKNIQIKKSVTVKARDLGND